MLCARMVLDVNTSADSAYPQPSFSGSIPCRPHASPCIFPRGPQARRPSATTARPARRRPSNEPARDGGAACSPGGALARAGAAARDHPLRPSAGLRRWAGVDQAAPWRSCSQSGMSSEGGTARRGCTIMGLWAPYQGAMNHGKPYQERS